MKTYIKITGTMSDASGLFGGDEKTLWLPNAPSCQELELLADYPFEFPVWKIAIKRLKLVRIRLTLFFRGRVEVLQG